MTIEVSTLPGGSGLVLSIAAYVGLSFLAGQEIGDRMIDKSGWHVECETAIHAEIESRRTPRSIVPERRCSDMVIWLPKEFRELCDAVGNPDINAPARRAEERLQKQQQALENKRLQRLADKAGTQCGCAVNVFKQDNMMSLALYAGSARMITPSPVDSLDQSLALALGTQQCQALAGGMS